MLQKLVIVLTDNEHSLHLNTPSALCQRKIDKSSQSGVLNQYILAKNILTQIFGEQRCDLEHFLLRYLETSFHPVRFRCNDERPIIINTINISTGKFSLS